MERSSHCSVVPGVVSKRSGVRNTAPPVVAERGPAALVAQAMLGAIESAAMLGDHLDRAGAGRIEVDIRVLRGGAGEFSLQAAERGRPLQGELPGSARRAR